MRLFAVTSNPGKLRELRAILAGSGIDIVHEPMWLGEEETGETYLENARLKATAGVRLLGLPVLAEDSGLEVDALGGAPGPRSARFAGPAADDDGNNAKLLRLMSGVPDAKRTARYRAAAVMWLPSGAEAAGEGVFEGRIGILPMGEGGFGYDPLFVPAGEQRTAAELEPGEKDRISHRARAIRRMVVEAREKGLL